MRCLFYVLGVYKSGECSGYASIFIPQGGDQLYVLTLVWGG